MNGAFKGFNSKGSFKRGLKGGLRGVLKGGLKGSLKEGLKGDLRRAAGEGINWIFFVFSPKASLCGWGGEHVLFIHLKSGKFCLKKQGELKGLQRGFEGAWGG